MVTPDQLYAATNDGLAIIALHYKDAPEAVRENRPFKARTDERTPSARVKLFQTRNGSRVYKLTDFGGEGRAIDPIEIHMRECNFSFYEAILDLARIFNITSEINRSINRPDVRKNTAKADQEDGSCSWDIDQEFTDKECKVMGPKVSPEILKALNWYRVKSITTVKNREATTKYSNENYPIFMRECWFTTATGDRDRFYKIYEPLNAEKQWRFQYQPAGKKPKSYINGLSELIDAYKKFNDAEEKIFFKDPDNEGKPYKTQKLPEAVICSGERDSLCVRSLGYYPLWFNSETYQVSEEEWRTITKYAETIYNIPDIDTTGRLKGTELAMRFIDIHTIWLPESLSKYKDNRGKPRKDFRDWMDYNQNVADFRNLLELATPAKFWATSRHEKTGKLRYSIDDSCLFEFLKLNGFWTLRDKHAASTQYVHIAGNIVSLVTPKEIRAFVLQWAINTARPRELRNLIITTPKLSAAQLEALQEIDPDFTNYTEHSQFFYFPKFALEVTGEGFIKHDSKAAAEGRYVWDENVIKHDISILPDMFEITHPEGLYDSADFDIKVTNNTSNYFRYLINSSRIYWRKELEVYPKSLSEEEGEKYVIEHKFDIAGPGLKPEEIQEQKQCLINKIFTIGYMLHRYKSYSRAWAPFAMDNIIGENDQCNGRSGKSFMFLALKNFTKWLKLSGRNPRLLDNQFVFEQVSEHLGIVTVDDCDEYLPFEQFYDVITSDITINPKNVISYTLPFGKAPKFAFTTNYVPKRFDGSSVGRMLFVVFSDYYHQKSLDNDYLESRPIRLDFGKDLFGSAYSEAEWEADINFILQCVRFYLSVSTLPVKIEPKMDNIIFRKHLRDMSDNFRDWAEAYFAVDQNGKGEHTDVEIVREEAFEDYKRTSGAIKTTMQKFTKQLNGFCYTCDYIAELNPEEMHNSGSRIIKRRENQFSHKMESKEMIYVRTIYEAERIKNQQQTPTTPVQENLPF